MRILLTNDDGYESCALLPTIKILEKIGTVETVVPKNQKSWTSKANIRRVDKIHISTKEIDGRIIHTLDALPADCANFGIYRYDDPPDLLISGANIGMNIGLGMFLSSGTIGAALEGLLANVPSIAISCPYQKGQKLKESEFEKSLKSIPRLIKAFCDDSEGNIAMLSLNLPLGIENELFEAVTIDRYHFGSLFKQSNPEFLEPKHYYELHSPKGEVKGTDAWARRKGLNSVVALNSLAQYVDREYVHQWLKKFDLT